MKPNSCGGCCPYAAPPRTAPSVRVPKVRHFQGSVLISNLVVWYSSSMEIDSDSRIPRGAVAAAAEDGTKQLLPESQRD